MACNQRIGGCHQEVYWEQYDDAASLPVMTLLGAGGWHFHPEDDLPPLAAQGGDTNSAPRVFQALPHGDTLAVPGGARSRSAAISHLDAQEWSPISVNAFPGDLAERMEGAADVLLWAPRLEEEPSSLWSRRSRRNGSDRVLSVVVAGLTATLPDMDRVDPKHAAETRSKKTRSTQRHRLWDNWDASAAFAAPGESTPFPPLSAARNGSALASPVGFVDDPSTPPGYWNNDA